MTSADWGPPGFRPERPHGTLRDVVQAGTHFDITGDGPALVLIHGVGLDLAMWEPVARRLANDYTVIRYDMLGHGGSAKPPAELTLRSFVSQLGEFADYLRLDRFALVGFSMGAMVALAYAVERPERISRLGLLNSVFERSRAEQAAVQERLRRAEAEGPAALIDAALERWFSRSWRAANPQAVEAVRRRLENNDDRGFLTAYRVFAGADAGRAGSLETIACPVLVATGAADRGSTPRMTRRLAAGFGNARAVVLDGLAHMAPVEGADSVTALLRDLLENPA